MIELDVIDSKTAETDTGSERFWRSLPDLKRDSDFKDAHKEEFAQGVSEGPGGASRRQFLLLMGASMAFAGLTGCRRPETKIVPYARKPEEVIPGIPQQYATAMPFRGVLRGLLVESREGRPTKIEGNPAHPNSQGATSGFEQASVLNLYDPDRSKQVLREGSPAAWSDFVSFARRLADGAEQRQVAVLVKETASPTVAALRAQMEARFPNLRWITYRPDGDDPVRLGMQQAFGQAVRPEYQFDEADVVVSLDADFLSPVDRNFVANTRRFAASRKLEAPDDAMSRLYAVDSAFSLTGGMADDRLRMRASRIPAFAAALAAELGVGSGSDVLFSEQEQRFAQAAARDLRNADGGIVLAGETQPPVVHALCMAINEALGSLGRTVQLLNTDETPAPPQGEQLAALAQDMRSGALDALFMLGVNPAYSMPAALGFREAMSSVPETVHLGLHVDETARASTWHLPQAHYLEAWGDGRAYDGTASVIQPLIAPLYDDAKSEIEVLNTIATGLDVAGYDLVREQWRERISGSFERGWRRVVHDGYLSDSQYAAANASGASFDASAIPAPIEDDYEVVFNLDPKLLDGRFSNNAWMQELPDPTTKIVWDNVAIMSPATAEAMGVDVEYNQGKFYADTVSFTLNGASVELPVWIQPGLSDGTIGLNLGYGRALSTNRPERNTPFWDTDDYTDIYADGPLAGGFNPGEEEPDNAVGKNVAPLRAESMERVTAGVTVEKTSSASYMLACTQEHGSMEGRPLARRATLEEYRDNPDFAGEMGTPVPGSEASGDAGYRDYPMPWEEDHPSDQPAIKDNPYYQNQWGMVIDLNTCTGCNACVVACTSENNVQVIGKEEVSRGRYMHWIRIDRYYVSAEEGADNPDMVMQPVMCQHCENAPCEAVCPVAATVHSPDGTNQMIYNRCIGTRYCSNNCPYKVRRFNFFNWSKTLPQEVQMAQNPNVTVRSRGVMEKCSFCVQRVRTAQSQAGNENRQLEDGEVQTACQQVCPAEAIPFGDLNNPDSEVVRQKTNSRRYELLAYLNTKPRVSYLGRVRNPSPSLMEEPA